MMTLKTIMAASAALLLCGCVIGSKGNGPDWIGKPASNLLSTYGAPDRQTTAPSGNLIYSYVRKSLNGVNDLCSDDYFVKGPTVVGYIQHGKAINCGAPAVGVTS